MVSPDDSVALLLDEFTATETSSETFTILPLLSTILITGCVAIEEPVIELAGWVATTKLVAVPGSTVMPEVVAEVSPDEEYVTVYVVGETNPEKVRSVNVATPLTAETVVVPPMEPLEPEGRLTLTEAVEFVTTFPAESTT